MDITVTDVTAPEITVVVPPAGRLLTHEASPSVEFGPRERLPAVDEASHAESRLERVRARSPFRRRRVAVLAGVLVGLIVLAVVAFAVFNSTVYFVGADGGSVALFHGMPIAPLGLELYRVVEVSPTPYGSLADYQRARVDTRELLTRNEGLQFIRGLGAVQ